MQVTTNLEALRTEALVRVARAALGAGVTRALPLPASAIASELGITAVDAWMLYDVYDVYYDDPPSPELLMELLDEAGLGVGGGLAIYGGMRVVQMLLASAFKSVPMVGWLLKGTMAGTSTFILGWLWQMFLEESLRPSPAVTTETPVYAEAGVGGSGITMVRGGAESTMILTERPDGKPGVSIPKVNYDLVRSTIMDLLRGENSIRLQQLIEAVEQVSEQLDKSPRWYVNTVKLDMEAHGVIERVPNQSPQELRLVDAT